MLSWSLGSLLAQTERGPKNQWISLAWYKVDFNRASMEILLFIKINNERKAPSYFLGAALGGSFVVVVCLCWESIKSDTQTSLFPPVVSNHVMVYERID